MGDYNIYRKMAMLIGTTTFAYTVFSRDDFLCPSFLPSSSYLNEKAFSDPYKLRTSLLGEQEVLPPIDNAIHVPVVRMVKFKFSKPEIKQFSA